MRAAHLKTFCTIALTIRQRLGGDQTAAAARGQLQSSRGQIPAVKASAAMGEEGGEGVRVGARVGGRIKEERRDRSRRRREEEGGGKRR